jgi:hypothetical protein
LQTIQLNGNRELASLPDTILYDWNSLTTCGVRDVPLLPSGTRGVLDRIIARNARVRWPLVLSHLLELSLILFDHLPAYVLLEVFDWLEDMAFLNHKRKISKIIAVYQSIGVVLKARN